MDIGTMLMKYLPTNCNEIPRKILLSSNQTTISNLSAGTYTLTVFDSVCNISL